VRVRPLIAGVMAAICLAQTAMARAPKLASDARVSSVEYHFIGPHVLGEADFSPMIATSGPGGLDHLQAATSWIPFVPDPHPHPFSAVVLQQDLERLRRQLRRKGFPEGQADYDVSVEHNRRDVRVTFTISEGEPTRVHSMTLLDGSAPDAGALPDSVAAVCDKEWRRLVKKMTGERLSDDLAEEARKGLGAALGDGGYPSAQLSLFTAADSAANGVDLTWRVAAGMRTRIGDIRVEGVKSVPEPLVVRQLGLEPGEWYSRRAIEQSRLQLQSVALFQRSDLVLAPPTSPDSGALIRALIQESRARLTNLELGYVTDGAGVTTQARWTHPNFTGGARSFDAIGLIQTGWGATNGEQDKLLRATLTLTQPYVASPRLSLNAGPSVERRDGRIDQSVSASLTGTLVYRFNALQSAALRYDYTYRKLNELHIPGLLTAAIDTLHGVAGLSDAIIDSLKTPDRIPQFIFFTSLGHLDDIARPRHGLVFKPNLSVTLPPGWGTVNFGKVDAQLTLFSPIPGRANALMLRGSAGAVWPFGVSVPGPGLGPVIEWYRLRDQVLKAGGATDVRGYASELLGPKYPVLETSVNGTDTVLSSSRYSPIGGLRRVTASAELRLAMPRFGPSIFAHLFADAGRVWTTDDRYRFSNLVTSADETRMFYTTGGGVGYYTPVGAIRFDFGYKLNPSVFDLRSPSDVLRALFAGKPATSAPVQNQRRYAFHLSLGLFF
jgi:outer membrane protein assembly factor BamA